MSAVLGIVSDFQSHKKKIRAAVKGSFKSSVELEFRILNKHGNIVWVRNKINLIRNSEGEVFWPLRDSSPPILREVVHDR